MSESIENKSILSADLLSRVDTLADKVGAFEGSIEGKLSEFRAEFKALISDREMFPRHANGAVDIKSDAFVELEERFLPRMMVAMVKTGQYDRPLHKSGEDEYHIPSDTRKANFTLTGANALQTDKKTLSKMPSVVEHPLGLRRFIEKIQKTVKNTAQKRIDRFVEADEPTSVIAARGANATVDEWIDGLAKPMIAKLGAARTSGRKVATNDGAKKALAQFRKALLG